MPRHRILCCDDVVCAAALYFMPLQCLSCCNNLFGCGNALRAAVKLFVPWQSSSCHGKALHAAAKLFVPRQISSCHGKSLHAAAKLFVPWQQNDAMALSGIVLRVAARVAARNEAFRTQKTMLLHSVACCVVQRCYSSCCGQVCLAAASFFVPQQETTHHSILRHRSLFRSKKQRTAAFCGIARHGASCRGIVCCAVAMFSHGATVRMGGGKKQSTCAALAITVA